MFVHRMQSKCEPEQAVDYAGQINSTSRIPPAADRRILCHDPIAR